MLFADLKGSTELLADRDPEEARKLLDPVLERMMEAVHRYEGTVNQVMGDGIMALFGAPVAHEDHAVRACYAALRTRRPCGATRRAPTCAGRDRPDPRGPQLRRCRGALDRERSPHGLHGRRPDHAPGGADGAARGARQHPAHRRHAAPGRRLRPGHPARPGAHQGARRAGGGVRAGGGRRRPHPPRGRGARGVSRCSSAGARSWSISARRSSGRARGTARWWPWSGSRAWASRAWSGKSPTPTGSTAGWSCKRPRCPTAGHGLPPGDRALRGYFAVDSRDDPRRSGRRSPARS